MRDIEGPLCVGKAEEMIDSVKTRIVYDAANRAYRNAFELHPNDPKKAFKKGKKDAGFIFSNVKSVDTGLIRKSLEQSYRKLVFD